MALKTEGLHAGEYIIAEGDMDMCREKVTVLSGQNLVAGAVVGRVSLGVPGRVSVPAVVGTGNGTASQVFAGPDVELGNYVVTLKTVVANGGVFSVVAPSGKALPDLTLTPGAGGTTTYRNSHINFSITDGSTDFALNDAFTFVVSTTAPVVVGTGNGTISGLSLGPDAKSGNYRVENIEAITNGGRFKVVGPDGNQVSVGSIVAGAGGTLVLSDQRQLNLTITDAATDFAVGDFFNVCVHNIGERGKGKVVTYDPTTFDGRHRVAGILFDAVDATAADALGMITSRLAVVRQSDLTYAAAITAGLKTVAEAEMGRNLGILAR
jgi:hypothetical protein